MIERRLILTVVLGAAATVAAAQEPQKDTGHVMVTPDKVTWVDAPPQFPKGAKIAFLVGHPTKEGPFTLRLQFPAGYKLMPHFHPTTEHVTVLAGSVAMGRGDTFDIAAAHPLSAGGFSVMPAGMHHYVYSKDGATIQAHGIGPFTVTYVNPADDPRRAAPAN
jgi:mannose-6-phosphate isomerase-like protein (cupin superfamily)